MRAWGAGGTGEARRAQDRAGGTGNRVDSPTPPSAFPVVEGYSALRAPGGLREAENPHQGHMEGIHVRDQEELAVAVQDRRPPVGRVRRWSAAGVGPISIHSTAVAPPRGRVRIQACWLPPDKSVVGGNPRLGRRLLDFATGVPPSAWRSAITICAFVNFDFRIAESSRPLPQASVNQPRPAHSLSVSPDGPGTG